MAGKTFEDFVDEQAADMVTQLKAHEDEKGGPGAWLDGDPTDWLTEAQQQLLALGDALDGGTPEEVRRRAAHACNLIMMTMQTEMAAR